MINDKSFRLKNIDC